MPSTKKRPGVEAGLSLASLRTVSVWERIERHGPEVAAGIPGLTEHETALRAIMAGAAGTPSHGKPKPHFTKSELDQVVQWKHSVGKNRIYNVKHLNANTDEAVKRHSKSAIDLAMNIDAGECLEEDGALSAGGRAAMQEAIGELGKLKGVGPATASAILSLVRPDVFCFMYDEAIDVFEKTRDYKVSNYLRVNNRCMQLARDLGADWTTARVAKTIWIASRFLAMHGRDLTAGESGRDGESGTDSDGDDVSDSKHSKKQRTM